MGYTKDGGIDINCYYEDIAGYHRPDDGSMQENSHQREKLELILFKQIFADKSEKGFNEAMVVTTSSFTKGVYRRLKSGVLVERP